MRESATARPGTLLGFVPLCPNVPRARPPAPDLPYPLPSMQGEERKKEKKRNCSTLRTVHGLVEQVHKISAELRARAHVQIFKHNNMTPLHNRPDRGIAVLRTGYM